jgi:histidine phosphotransferase ChpT
MASAVSQIASEDKLMAADMELSDLELAALVSSKICHDIISPVGAIANGLEVMDEETDQVMRDHALDLIRSSATQASAKLQFARLAFGAAGSAGAEIDILEAEKVARMVAEAGKHTLEWSGPPARIVKDKVKLLLNMITLALAALPRGGALKVTISGEGDALSFTVRCQGESARIPEKLAELMTGSTEHALDAHSIQPFYTLRIATAAGMSFKAESDGSDIVFTAS